MNEVGSSGESRQANTGGINIANTGTVRDITVLVGAERFWTEEFPLGRTPDEQLRGLPPSQLLAARHQVVPFDPRREAMLHELEQWRDDPGGIKVRLIHGPGGQGKTRLAMEVAAQSRKAEWAVVRARHCTDLQPSTEAADETPTRAAGLLVIIDYAERWPLADLLAVLSHRLVRQGVPTRVVLLARPADWLSTLRHEAGKLDATCSATALRSLAGQEPADRRAVFNAARDRFSEILSVEDVGVIEPPGALNAKAFELALTVHMAALVAVDAHMRRRTPPSDPAALSNYLLDREWAHWDLMRSNGRIRIERETLARVAFTATLTRPVPHDEGVEILRDRGRLADTTETVHALLTDHKRCYPPSEPGTVLEPLYPDRLGEDFLAALLPDPASPGREFDDPWTPTAITRLLAAKPDEPRPSYRGAAIAVLIETAQRWRHVADRYLMPLLLEQPGLAIAAGGPALTRLAATANIDLLERIEELLPEDRHVELDVAAAAITQRLTDYRVAQTDEPMEQAFLLETLGVRLANAGLHPQALAATEQAVDIRRRLADANPAAYEPDLARGLWGFAWVRAEGQVELEEALSAVIEAVEIYQHLSQRLPAAFIPDLQAALHTLAAVLDALGRGQEADEIRALLAAEDPDDEDPGAA